MSAKPEDQSESGGFDVGFNATSLKALTELSKKIDKLIKISINPQKTSGGQNTYATNMKNLAGAQRNFLEKIAKNTSEANNQRKDVIKRLNDINGDK